MFGSMTAPGRSAWTAMCALKLSARVGMPDRDNKTAIGINSRKRRMRSPAIKKRTEAKRELPLPEAGAFDQNVPGAEYHRIHGIVELARGVAEPPNGMPESRSPLNTLALIFGGKDSAIAAPWQRQDALSIFRSRPRPQVSRDRSGCMESCAPPSSKAAFPRRLVSRR